jgi:hypothetical protein
MPGEDALIGWANPFKVQVWNIESWTQQSAQQRMQRRQQRTEKAQESGVCKLGATFHLQMTSIKTVA